MILSYQTIYGVKLKEILIRLKEEKEKLYESLKDIKWLIE